MIVFLGILCGYKSIEQIRFYVELSKNILKKYLKWHPPAATRFYGCLHELIQNTVRFGEFTWRVFRTGKNGRKIK